MKTARDKFIENKIKKIHEDGIRGKKVSNKQAVAVAYSYAKERRTGNHASRNAQP